MDFWSISPSSRNRRRDELRSAFPWGLSPQDRKLWNLLLRSGDDAHETVPASTPSQDTAIPGIGLANAFANYQTGTSTGASSSKPLHAQPVVRLPTQAEHPINLGPVSIPEHADNIARPTIMSSILDHQGGSLHPSTVAAFANIAVDSSSSSGSTKVTFANHLGQHIVIERDTSFLSKTIPTPKSIDELINKPVLEDLDPLAKWLSTAGHWDAIKAANKAIVENAIAPSTHARYQSTLEKTLTKDLPVPITVIAAMFPIKTAPTMTTLLTAIHAAWLQKGISANIKTGKVRWHAIAKIKAAIIYANEVDYEFYGTRVLFKQDEMLRFFKGLKAMTDHSTTPKHAPSIAELIQLHQRVFAHPDLKPILSTSQHDGTASLDFSLFKAYETNHSTSMKTVSKVIRGLIIATSCFLGERRNSEAAATCFANWTLVKPSHGTDMYTPEAKNDRIGKGHACHVPRMKIKGFSNMNNLIMSAAKVKALFTKDFGRLDNSKDYILFKYSISGKNLPKHPVTGKPHRTLNRLEPRDISGDLEFLYKYTKSPLAAILADKCLISYRKGGTMFYASFDRQLAQNMGGWRSGVSQGVSAMVDNIYSPTPIQTVREATQRAANQAPDEILVRDNMDTLGRAATRDTIMASVKSLARELASAILRSGHCFSIKTIESARTVHWATFVAAETAWKVKASLSTRLLTLNTSLTSFK